MDYHPAHGHDDCAPLLVRHVRTGSCLLQGKKEGVEQPQPPTRASASERTLHVIAEVPRPLPLQGSAVFPEEPRDRRMQGGLQLALADADIADG
ncbi:MAG: hypothetical protein C3F10_05390 [Dehalococcoidia bacterium]|nr:MAG: hypothetical protein C3F10_05390 [Dehalococcoidia bacterium]